VDYDSTTYTNMIEVYANAGNPTSAIELHLKAQDEGIIFDGHADALVIRSIATAGDLEEANKWLLRLDSAKRLNVEAVNAVMDGYMRAGQLENAQSAFALLRKHDLQPTTTTYNCLMHRAAQDGDVETVEHCLKQMSSKRLPPDSFTWTLRIAAYANAGQYEQAQTCFKQMVKNGFSPSKATCSAMMKAFAVKHKVAAAEEFLADIENPSKPPHVEPNEAMYNILMNIYAAERDLPAAEGVLYRFKTLGLAPDLASFGAILKASSRVGDLHRALHWAKRAESTELELDLLAYNSLLAACAKVGDLNLAFSIVERVKASGIQEEVVLYSNLINTCATAADPDLAVQKFNEMRAKGISPNSYTMNAMMKVFAAAGLPQQAELWLSTIARMGVKPEVENINRVMQSWANRGDSHRVDLWFQRMAVLDLAPDAITFNQAIMGASKLYDPELADSLFGRMQEAGITPTIATFRSLLKTFANAGLVEEVSDHVGLMQRQKLPNDVVCIRAILLACSHQDPPNKKVAIAAFMRNQSILQRDRVARSLLLKILGNEEYTRFMMHLSLATSEGTQTPTPDADAGFAPSSKKAPAAKGGTSPAHEDLSGFRVSPLPLLGHSKTRNSPQRSSFRLAATPSALPGEAPTKTGTTEQAAMAMNLASEDPSLLGIEWKAQNLGHDDDRAATSSSSSSSFSLSSQRGPPSGSPSATATSFSSRGALGRSGAGSRVVLSKKPGLPTESLENPLELSQSRGGVAVPTPTDLGDISSFSSSVGRRAREGRKGFSLARTSSSSS